MSNIIIGKHTLESLTSGMYSDAYVVFREYIQNSVDSIDDAIRTGVLSLGKEKIVIRVNPSEEQIVITDNGLGIKLNDVEKTLISIGNSKKTANESRGFRGIGRLAALSYCSKLTFSTTFQGEPFGTQIVIDALKLSEILIDDSKVDVTITDVLESVYTHFTYLENENAHYFKVQMDGVDAKSGLLSYNDVIEYLAQNSPVPYSPEFVWGREIVKRLHNEGLEVKSYNIFIEYGTNIHRIFKPYKDEFVVDKGKRINDTVQDIRIIKIIDEHAKLVAIGWIAKTNYKGSIYDKTIKGIRLRKGNILIGDEQTLNVIFKDARFNGWSIGEVFAKDKLLIPNARRDNFEKNPTYFYLFEQLTTIAVDITRDIRSASLKRNAPLKNAITHLNEASVQASTAMIEGVSGAQKGLITKKLKETQSEVAKTTISNDSEQYYQNIAFEEIDMLIGKLKGTTKYKALNTLSTLTNTEKKILERVISVIESLDITETNTIIDSILTEFSDTSVKEK